MSLINRFGKSRTVQHFILVWIKRFQVDYATNNGENYTISLIKSVQRERERKRVSETNAMRSAFTLFCGDP